MLIKSKPKGESTTSVLSRESDNDEIDRDKLNVIVKKLNNEINAKYNSVELRNDFPEFEYEDCQRYLTLEMDPYNHEIIVFQGVILYGESYHWEEGHDNKKVTLIVKEWFNKYLDSIVKLKFN